MIAECDGCSKESEFQPPAYIWLQNVEEGPSMLVRASLCRSCLVAMLAVVRPDLRPPRALQAHPDGTSGPGGAYQEAFS